jgi:hypothetical protein
MRVSSTKLAMVLLLAGALPFGGAAAEILRQSEILPGVE